MGSLGTGFFHPLCIYWQAETVSWSYVPDRGHIFQFMFVFMACAPP